MALFILIYSTVPSHQNCQLLKTDLKVTNRQTWFQVQTHKHCILISNAHLRNTAAVRTRKKKNGPISSIGRWLFLNKQIISYLNRPTTEINDPLAKRLFHVLIGKVNVISSRLGFLYGYVFVVVHSILLFAREQALCKHFDYISHGVSSGDRRQIPFHGHRRKRRKR